MYSTSITLKNKALADVVFNKISSTATESTFLDASTTLSAPRRVIVKHTMAKDGVEGVDRHLISVPVTKLDASNKPKVLTVNLSVQAPRGVITRADIDDALALAKNMVGTDALVTQLLNGEV